MSSPDGTRRDRTALLRGPSRGCIRDCACSCPHPQLYILPETRQTLFPTVFRSSVDSVDLSLSPENVPLLNSGTLFERLLMQHRPDLLQHLVVAHRRN